MSEIPTTIKGCKERLRGTTIESTNLTQDYGVRAIEVTLKDNGNRYHITFMKSIVEGFTIIPNDKTCAKRSIPAPKGSKNLPDAMRKFAKELNIKDPNYFLETRTKRMQLLK